MANKMISKKALWEKGIEDFKALYSGDLDEPLETYFHKTRFRITFIKELPASIKIKLINTFFNIYD
jgi:hypothetical protein